MILKTELLYSDHVVLHTIIGKDCWLDSSLHKSSQRMYPNILCENWVEGVKVSKENAHITMITDLK